MDIVSKFTIASEDGIRNLFMLKEIQTREMYKGSVEEVALNAFIKLQLDERGTINDLNNEDFLSRHMKYEHKKPKYTHEKRAKNRTIKLFFLYLLLIYKMNAVSILIKSLPPTIAFLVNH